MQDRFQITRLQNYPIIQLSFLDFPASQAGRANADTLARALPHFGVDWAQIDVPSPLGHIVGVADVVSKLRPFAADLAYLCHDCSELILISP
jgi:hypothetical protein